MDFYLKIEAQLCYDSFSAHTDLSTQHTHTHTHTHNCNQKLFKAREVSWNKGTSVHILSTTHERKAPQENISEFFLLDTLKTAFYKNKFNP